jgi:hypothetical protein
MRGESDRECRARGGKIPVHPDGKGSPTLKAFHSNAPTTGRPDASLKRGAGPLFRKRGGRLPEAFVEREGDPEDREDRAIGGAISGAGAKPSMGRAGRKSGGGVGADLKPLTCPVSPAKPKGRKIMGEGEKSP